MYARFQDVFAEEGVTNVVWVMDYAGLADHLDTTAAMWPDIHPHCAPSM